MSTKSCLLYATVDGQTLKICNEIVAVFKENGQEIDLWSIEDFKGEIANYDRFIIGSSIRYGVHNKDVIEFVNTNQLQLDKVKNAFFSVNLVARKPEKNQADTNPYVIKFFEKIDWKPNLVEVFAGKLDYKKYGFFDRKMIQLIMWITKGPTDLNTKIDYTNWEEVKDFANKLCVL